MYILADGDGKKIKDLEFQLLVLFILNRKMTLFFGICYFLYFFMLPAGRGLFFFYHYLVSEFLIFPFGI